MAFWLIAAVWLAAAPAQAEPINAVLAVVDGAPITRWDLDTEARLRALEQRGVIPLGALPREELGASLDQLINQLLAVQAAERFHVPWPSESAVASEIELMERGMPQPVTQQLARAEIPLQRLVERLRIKGRIRALIDQRLRSLVQISPGDVRAYLAEYPAADTGAAEMVEEYLAAIELQKRSRAFFLGLRERARVHILDPAFADAWRNRDVTSNE